MFIRNKSILYYIVSTISVFCCDNAFGDNAGFFYLDIGAGVAKIGNLPNPALSVGVNAGYSFNKYFALEAQWSGQPSFQWNNYLLNNYNIYDLAVKGSVPFNDTVSMYGKIGYGLDYSSWSGTPDKSSPNIYATDGSAFGTNTVMAIGINYNISKDLSIYLENNSYIPVTKGNGSFSYSNSTMLGLSYNFGRRNSYISAPPIEDDHIGNVISNPEFYSQYQTESGDFTNEDLDAIESSSCRDYYSDEKCHTISQRLIEQADGSAYIIVLSGDTLSDFSRVFGVKVSRLKQLNHCSDRIIVGQKIFIRPYIQ